jgi:hypothetical protein
MLELTKDVPLNPQGLAMASGSRGFPDQLTFFPISLLRTKGVHSDCAVLRSMRFPIKNMAMLTFELLFAHGTDLIPVVNVGVFNIIQEKDGRFHLLRNLEGNFTSVTGRSVLFRRINRVSHASVVVGIGHIVLLERYENDGS